MSDNPQSYISGDRSLVTHTAIPHGVASNPLPVTPAPRISPMGMGSVALPPMGVHGLSPQGSSFPHMAPMMNMQSGVLFMQYYNPSSAMNAPQLSQSDAPITGQSSGSVKHSRTEGSTSDPSKKAKKKRAGDGEETKTRLWPNKIWLPEHDDVLIPYLAEQARKGLKCDKAFKRVAFESAAGLVNSVFKTDFTPENVINHMRSLKSRYYEMASVFQKINGAVWDKEKQMITVDKVTYDNIKEENAKLKELINTPLKHFENLKTIICSDEFATGEFRKSVYNSFGGGGESTGDKSDDHVEVAGNGDKFDDPVEVASDDNQMPLNTANHILPPPARMEKLKKDKSPPTRKTKHHEIDNVIVASVKEMADAIRHAHIEHWSKELSALVYKHVKYPTLVLDEAFDFFYDDEKKARRFIAKPFAAQDRMIKEFIAMSGMQIAGEGNEEESQGDGLGEDVVDI